MTQVSSPVPLKSESRVGVLVVGAGYSGLVAALLLARRISICDRFAPGTSSLVEDVFTLTPPKLEQHFGFHRGHIHHLDNSFGFSDRLPYRTPIAGLYSASAACHPAGSVIGAAGHNAAQCLLQDLHSTQY